MRFGRREALLRCNAAGGVSARAVRRMLQAFSPEDILEAPAAELAAAAEAPLDAAERFQREALAFDADGELAAAARLGAAVVMFDDPGVPDLLKSITDPPLVLYVRGRLDPAATALSFVGSRRPTPYGGRMARQLAGEAAAAGLAVVSGLARGIDSEAHRAALKASGTTWAVLGSGLGRLYPPENESLAREIEAGGGCLLSEFPLETPPFPENFPRRNRIVSGLSWATVVVEGRERSGSLITARLAAEQGREVFAVPGPADSPLSEAPHRLIRQGARLIRSLADIWEDLPAGCRGGRAAPGPAAPPATLSSDQQKILQCMGPDARTLEELGAATGLDFPRLSEILFEMELRELVGPVPGQRYAKKGS